VYGYTGKWEDDMRDGEGWEVLLYETYEGSVSNDVHHGHGIITRPWLCVNASEESSSSLQQHQCVQRTGTWEYRCPLEGRGYDWNIAYPTGSMYHGEVKNGTPNGWGTMFYMETVKEKCCGDTGDGNDSGEEAAGVQGVYTGEFLNGMHHGKGTYMQNGKKYIEVQGTWENEVLLVKEYGHNRDDINYKVSTHDKKVEKHPMQNTHDARGRRLMDILSFFLKSNRSYTDKEGNFYICNQSFNDEMDFERSIQQRIRGDKNVVCKNDGKEEEAQVSIEPKKTTIAVNKSSSLSSSWLVQRLSSAFPVADNWRKSEGGHYSMTPSGSVSIPFPTEWEVVTYSGH